MSVLLLFLLLLLILWLRQEITVIGYFVPQEERLNVHASSAWGMVYTLPLLLLVFGLVVPFLSAEGVARDLKQRTHELLMATAIPTRACVWGRYTAVLVVNLLLATFLLVAVLLIGVAFSLAIGYPFPNLAATLALWAVAVLPATVLLSGLSFALGTQLPRYTNFVKVLIVAAWFLLSFEGLLAQANNQAATFWDPSSRTMIAALGAPYRQALFKGLDSLPVALDPRGEQPAVSPAPLLTGAERVRALRRRMQDVEQQMPDLWPWVGPHAALALAGLAAPLLVAGRFRRFNGLL